MHVDLGRGPARNQQLEMAGGTVFLHDRIGLHGGVGGKPDIVAHHLTHFHFYSAQAGFSEVRLFLRKSRVGSNRFVYTRSENALEHRPSLEANLRK
jgi:hypothetical protein